MKILVAEDDFASRKMMQKLLEPWGTPDVAIDGREAVEAFELAWDEGEPYELVFMDIMMPKLDGQGAIKAIRAAEKARGVNPTAEARIIVTSVLEDPRNVVEAYFKGGATGYLVKPIGRSRLEAELAKLGFRPTR